MINISHTCNNIAIRSRTCKKGVFARRRKTWGVTAGLTQESPSRFKNLRLPKRQSWEFPVSRLALFRKQHHTGYILLSGS